MSDQEFSEQEVLDIVTAAMKSLGATATIPLSYSDSSLLEKLYHLLPKYLGTYSDAQYVISQLRQELYENTSKLTAQQLHTITKNCTKCPDALSKASSPLWNIADPDLLLIVDNPYITQIPSQVNLLVEALKRAGFNSQRVALSFATRCSFTPRSLAGEHYANCVAYLHNEIHALQPKLVVAFGSAVYGVLTGDSQAKLKDIKGEIIWLGVTPIMPTYSLAYFERAYGQKEDTVSYLESDLRKAHTFCYGEH